MIGEMLERRYRVDAPIARGGMSTVYRGLDTRLDRPVAIKVMDPQFAGDPAFLTRFEFEARAVARLKHPSLVAVYDQGSDRNHVFLVMELVDGGTLRELLRERGPMPPHAVAAVVAPVLDALAVAHRAGLVHRDVKPENILISDTGEVKIADFGLVRAAAAATTTSNSVILGTAAYLSPEQVTSGIADTRSDVYSTGVLMFELLTGTTPFTGDTSLSIAYQRIHDDVPRPGSRIPGVPAQFDRLVAEATHREPAHRFADAGEMAAALRSVSEQLELPSYRVPAPRRSAQHQSAQVAPARPQPAPAPPTDVHPNSAARPNPGATTVLASGVAPAAAATTALGTGSPLPGGIQHTRAVTAQTARPATVDGDSDFDDGSDFGDDQLGPDDPHAHFVEARRKSRRATLIWLLVIAVLALALGFGGWWMGSGRYTAVPSIDGLTKDTAVTALQDAGLSPDVQGQYSDAQPIDTVIGTDPASGSRVTKGSTVALLTSLGRPTVPPIPAGGDVSALGAQLADRTLVAVDGGDTFSSKIPIGGVAALDPAPGTEVAVGSSVKVITSKGSPPVDIPDVKGMSENAARAALDKVGISVSTTRTTFDDAVEGGSVIGTDPAVGSSVNAGTSVVLLISDSVKVPSLIGRSVSSAREELGRLGLEITVRQLTQNDSSVIISQSVKNDLVAKGTDISVVAIP
ncbi:Stk1 family PASTA domain-containing Ser/Thr kinase [Rhodococcus erythropolis]|uniref:non-specific serine/threonine protein kinase n=1 Tax=Rhodococcus erythropolis (strain PR4 / NBRC 100887) TaxID=234621 RepID=C1A0Z9_RHOE4|nr:Stk1 family PASTA domain-containing Ser/Thr kinase [Rhodococcus erythropolis]BAH34284.1 putative serine/threonine protein kinase PknL [Rhodococcus erythropolis PR4]